jgi:hypothetical protein
MPVARFREELRYTRVDEDAEVKLQPNEEVVSSKVHNVNGEQHWVFIVKRVTAR